MRNNPKGVLIIPILNLKELGEGEYKYFDHLLKTYSFDDVLMLDMYLNNEDLEFVNKVFLKLLEKTDGKIYILPNPNGGNLKLFSSLLGSISQNGKIVYAQDKIKIFDDEYQINPNKDSDFIIATNSYRYNKSLLSRAQKVICINDSLSYEKDNTISLGNLKYNTKKDCDTIKGCVVIHEDGRYSRINNEYSKRFLLFKRSLEDDLYHNTILGSLSHSELVTLSNDDRYQIYLDVYSKEDIVEGCVVNDESIEEDEVLDENFDEFLSKKLSPSAKILFDNYFSKTVSEMESNNE